MDRFEPKNQPLVAIGVIMMIAGVYFTATSGLHIIDLAIALALLGSGVMMALESQRRKEALFQWKALGVFTLACLLSVSLYGGAVSIVGTVTSFVGRII